MTDQSLLSVSADQTGIKMMVKEIKENLAPAVADAAARGISNLLYNHFLKRNERTGRPGWPKSDYWADAAESVIVSSGQNGDAVVMARAPGLLMHRDGGTILPKRGRFLAIPIHPMVARIWPREVMQREKAVKLIPVRGGKGEGYLLALQVTDEEKLPLWRLVRRSKIKADPSVLPTEMERTNAAKDAAKAALEALTMEATT